MVCTMAANNETGVISDLDGIAAVLREPRQRAYWMVDCVQALGKLPLASPTRIDYAPFSGHKLYAPKGIGMLYVREGAPYTPLMCGGGQEAGQRSGTENMAGIAALGAVLARWKRAHLPHARRTGGCATRLAAPCASAFPASSSTPRSNTRCRPPEFFACPGVPARSCSTCSTRPACASARARPVRRRRPRPATCWRRWACRLPWRAARECVRLSFGAAGDDAFIDEACARIAAADVAAVPLSRLADRAGDWLRSEQRPLVFFCRSGGRSEKAARCLHRLGYHNAWHVSGKLSLS
jgi:cysteine desulfurase